MAKRYVVCHCCDAGFLSGKPHDPERDKGYGTCADCAPRVAESWAKHGFGGPQSGVAVGDLEGARARLRKYA